MIKQNKKTVTEDDLKEFALNFEQDIVKRLVDKGFNRYNIFDILNINRQELRHSDFLAFLFDSNNNGNIAEQFLRKFLLSKEIIDKFDFIEILYGNIENTVVNREVSTEDGRIDILVEFELDKMRKQKYVLAIENKIDSSEHDNQLARYKNFLSQGRYRNCKKILLYLTIDREPPRDDDWIAVDYRTVCDALEQISTDNADKSVSMLVNDYKEILKREFIMENNELKTLARDIYTKNKLVLDFIYNCLPDWTETAAPIVRDFLRRKGYELQSEKQKVNIMFHKKDLDVRYWFQINLRDLSLFFMDKKMNWKTVSKQKWLVDHDRITSANTVERYAELDITNPEKLREECEAMLEQAFEHGNLIAQCVADIKIYEKKLDK